MLNAIGSCPTGVIKRYGFYMDVCSQIKSLVVADLMKICLGQEYLRPDWEKGLAHEAIKQLAGVFDTLQFSTPDIEGIIFRK